MQIVQTDQYVVYRKIASRLTELLSVGPTTWFVSGGSNIAIQVQVLQALKAEGVDLGRLKILLIDERFGPVGHDSSNWKQLQDAGFMIGGPVYISPFTEAETTLDQATARYQQVVGEVLNGSDFVFCQVGMGDDGHTSGILPGSIAALEQTELVCGYEHAPYQRLTTTFPALQRMDEVCLVAYGPSKWPKLEDLCNKVGSQLELPIRVLTDIPLVTIYTDYETTSS